MSKHEDNEYTLEDGAYGLYLSTDVDIGSRYYSKEKVDALVKSMEKRIKKINKRLRNTRQKYKEAASLLAWRKEKGELQ